ncbi:MAG: glycerol-3-phosphate 1-O-acyltransferase PlsY [Bacteroidetes bacterium]|nr:glycerol-3-phosphate 1-O-acyltransferase PlsY [Bacteroidota bacterium]MCK4360803.1 glycerol-3-phosphate 1-O-acyltransferase PlsY [Bacteroidales bacterium]MCK4638836.1 glycerol-3-phosphate 1-O-acyltransferase PlsY [Bacteroidales bacterium]
MTLQIILLIILAYLIGSIPTSVWIGKWFYKVDVRTKGSGNAGATNTIRVLGWKAGIPVLLFDVFKGWFAVYMSNFILSDVYTGDQFINIKIVFAVAAVIGHIFPVYVRFKGGKGVATLLGVGIALFSYSVLVAVGVFVIVLVISRIVSISSIIASIFFPFIVVFIFNVNNLSLIIMSIAVAVFIPLTHLKNIKRLIKGEESRFVFKKKSSC